MLKRLLVFVLLAPLLALAQAAEPAGRLTTESIIRHTIEGRIAGAKIESVTKTPYLGLYEVHIEGEPLFYTDEKMKYFFNGSIHDGRNMQDLTEKRVRELARIKWENLPLGAAVKTVRGNGKRVLAVFSDPNCPYCKRFERDVAKVGDITIYTFLYPILSKDSHDKSKAVWCAPDKSRAWSELMLNGKTPEAGRCDTPIENNLALGRKYRVTGTPTLIFANGERVPGAIPMEQLEKLFAQNEK